MNGRIVLRRAATSLTLCLLLASAASGRQDDWVNVGLGGGGGIYAPVSSPHDPNLMFCASDMSGVYRSIDGGRTWRMLHWRQLSSAYSCPVIFHPLDPNVMYCIPGPWGKPVLKVSRDKGLTWKPLTEAMPWYEKTPQSTLLGIDPAGEILLVSSDKGTFRSDDEGKSWTEAKGIKAKVLAFFFEPPQVGGFWYAATHEGVFRSRDRGRTWQRCPSQPPGKPVVSFCGGADEETGQVVLFCSVQSREVNGKFAGGIFRSTDRGETWHSAMGRGLNTAIGRHGAGKRRIPEYPFIGMASNQTRTVYAFCHGTGYQPPYHTTVYRSDDAGETWRATLFFRPGVEGQNVELSWIWLDRGHGERPIGFSVNARNSNYVTFTNAMELYLTGNGGKTWRQSYTRCAEGRPAPRKRWQSIGLEMTTTWYFRFDPHDPNRCYICYTDIGFARSIDRGKTWYWSPRGSPWKNTFYDIAFDPDKPGVIYAACAYEHDIPSWKMAGRVYGGGGVCVSTDYGETWRPISEGLPSVGACTAVELDPNSPPDRRTLYAAVYGGGIYKSTDGGRSWKPKNKGLKTDRNHHFTDVKLHRDGTLYALCGAKRKSRYEPAAVGGLFKSTDGGESWTDLTEGMNLYLPYGFDVHPKDSNILYLCVSAVPRRHNEAGVYKSTDGGKTWKKLKIDWPSGGPAYVHAKYPSIDPYNPDRVWVSTGTHGLIVTTDAGKTWKEVKGVPFKGVNRVTVDPRDHETIWLSTFGGGIWRGPATEAE